MKIRTIIVITIIINDKGNINKTKNNYNSNKTPRLFGLDCSKLTEVQNQ